MPTLIPSPRKPGERRKTWQSSHSVELNVAEWTKQFCFTWTRIDMHQHLVCKYEVRRPASTSFFLFYNCSVCPFSNFGKALLKCVYFIYHVVCTNEYVYRISELYYHRSINDCVCIGFSSYFQYFTARQPKHAMSEKFKKSYSLLCGFRHRRLLFWILAGCPGLALG